MIKINLLASQQSQLATNPAFRYLLDPWFNIVIAKFPNPKKFNPNDTVILASMWFWETWQHVMTQAGFKLVIDNTWESWDSWQREYPKSFDTGMISLVLQPQKFFWYHEYCWSKYRIQQGIIESYQPCRQPQYRALMQMNLIKEHRNRIFNALGSRTDQMLWSYRGLGHHVLPGDSVPNGNLNLDSMRFFNPEWYDKTGFTLAVETYDDLVTRQQTFGPKLFRFKGPWPFVTEKTWKPIQYQHPFVSWAMSNTLKTLQQWGFVTYDNLFDESYDGLALESYQQKIQIILDNFDNFALGDYDLQTQQRIEHNYVRFNDCNLVEKFFNQDIINPILEVVNSGKN